MELEATNSALNVKSRWEEYCLRKKLLFTRGTIKKDCGNGIYEVKMDQYSKLLKWSGHSLTLHRVEERSYDLPMIG
jgi:hypothetical protein